jgi:hypothetical protein
LFVIIMKQVLRQTGGTGEVASRGAVFDAHGGLGLSPIRCGFACHTHTPFLDATDGGTIPTRPMSAESFAWVMPNDDALSIPRVRR